MNERLLSSQRINKSRTFQTIFKKGKRFQGNLLNVWVYTASQDAGAAAARPKLAVMVSRKAFSKAVDRNLWKRRLREVFRRLQQRLDKGVALIFQAKKQSKIASCEELGQEILHLFEKAKILK